MGIIKTLGVCIIENNDDPNNLAEVKNNDKLGIVKTANGQKTWYYSPGNAEGSKWVPFIDGDDVLSENFKIRSDKNDVRLGADALKYSKGEKYNIAVGHYALENANANDNNIAVGYGSQDQNTGGNGNVSVGNWSLYFNTSGHHNLAFGYSAGQKITGSYNIAIGKESLFQTLGSYNLAVGINAGTSHKNGDNNIYIGKNAGKETESNMLYLGNIKNGKSIIEGNMDAEILYIYAKTLNIPNLPTSADKLNVGDLWNDNGTLKIVTKK